MALKGITVIFRKGGEKSDSGAERHRGRSLLFVGDITFGLIDRVGRDHAANAGQVVDVGVAAAHGAGV